MIGQTISHYRVLEKLGAGGMGEVYRAHDEQLDRDVALKLLPAGTLSDEAARKQFRKEALALAKLNHPNIETVHEFGTQDGVDFLVMELIVGSSLNQQLNAGPLQEREIVRLGMQFAEGLAAAHERGVVHRDLKPSNLMVTPDGRVKILDFGLAKLVHHDLGTVVTRSITMEAGTISGTVPYMSPEQLRGLPVDARGDIYAAGAVLYEMATGRRPFPQSQSAELMGAILHQPPPMPSSLNPCISPGLESVILKTLEKEPSQRYQSARELLVALEGISFSVAAPVAVSSAASARATASRPRWLLIAAAAVGVTVLATGAYFYFHRPTKLTEKDTIVLADFTNTTGDAVFDGTLRQGLAVDLGQSPFLNILSEQKVRQTLRQMTRSPGERLTQDLAREVCQRAGSKAYLVGSIAALGTQYVIGLEALNCASGDVLAREQVTAAGKEQVLPALGQAASKLRRELGESLGSVQTFDVPLAQATTGSLEALKAYTLGAQTHAEKGAAEAIPFYKRAIELDPDFAMAYRGLAGDYYNLSQPSLAGDYVKKAFDLRDRATEIEKFDITSIYYLLVTGELEKAVQTFELWGQAYPRDEQAHANLGTNYMVLGQYEKAAAETREAMRLRPNDVTQYENLAAEYLALNRFDEARDISEQAQSRRLDDINLHLNLYGLAFLQGNAAALKQQTDWALGRAGAEDSMLSVESDTEAYFGRLQKARELSRRAVESALRANAKESAALWEVNAAIREVIFGNPDEARKGAAAALAIAPESRDAVIEAALAYAFAGDLARARSLAGLAKRFPENTVVQSVWLPTIRAQLAIAHKDPAQSIELLQPAVSYELGLSVGNANNSCLYPVYVRGQAYLSARQGQSAAAEFQKILDHRGLVWNCPTGALAHLGLGRAFALAAAGVQGDTSKARAAYNDFLTLWKDADPDIPILKEAKAEYAKLQ